ncbi:MAG: glycosyltransferase, partial [Candidatus Latescibacteria bacterium]|nr:glycosyltransferase [Candidatus Latescibacterota bacterium]
GLLSLRPDSVLAAAASLRSSARSGRLRGLFAHTGPGHAVSALALDRTPAPVIRVRADIRPPARGPFQRWLYTRKTDRILVTGVFRIEAVRSVLGDGVSDRIAVLPAGIDTGPISGIDRVRARSRLRERMGWPPDCRVVGALARYSPVKGYADLVDAARRIAERMPDVRFFCAGPPGQLGREEVTRRFDAAGLRGRFAVEEAVDDPLAVAAAFDVAVIASIGSEAVCRSALEYLALGVPVVATRVHVIPETIGEAGLLVPPGEPDRLAEAIERLLCDARLRAALRETGPRRVGENYEMERIARGAIEILEAARMERGRR